MQHFTKAEIRQIDDLYQEFMKVIKAKFDRERIDRIEKAFRFANAAHEGIKRKSGEPFILHPLSVSMIVAKNIGLGATSICASILHDVVEDTDRGFNDIHNMLTTVLVKRRSISFVMKYVIDLTDVYDKTAYPELNRRERKSLERNRLAQIDSVSQSIKYADIIHNTSSIILHDPNFAKVYLKEIKDTLEVMNTGDFEMYENCCDLVQRGIEMLQSGISIKNANN